MLFLHFISLPSIQHIILRM